MECNRECEYCKNDIIVAKTVELCDMYVKCELEVCMCNEMSGV